MDIKHCPHVFERFTYKGHCAECDPELMKEYTDRAKFYADLEDRFEAETGKKALENWAEYERFLTNLFLKRVMDIKI